MPAIRIPNLTLRRHVWFARLIVPTDVQDRLGKRVLIQTTGERDVHRAVPKAQALVATWKAQIEAARKGDLTDAQRLAQEFRKARNVADGSERELLEDVIAWALKRAPANVPALADTVFQGDVHAALKATPGTARVLEVLDTVTSTQTPLATLLDAWKGHLEGTIHGRQVHQYVTVAQEFCKETGATLEGLTRAKVQSWIAKVAATQAPKTLARKLASMRNLWRWAQVQGHVDPETDPFHGVVLPRRVQKGPKREAWSPSEIASLVQAANPELAKLITLAAYTGARIEELCQLRIEHVNADRTVLVIPGTKTEAAARSVPIVPALRPLVKDLQYRAAYSGGSSNGDYLLVAGKVGKAGERSINLGGQFSKMARRLGYPETLVFHSIRKTVATLLEQAGCPEGIAADVLGHKKKTMSYGLYSAGTSMDQRREWLEKALVYPPLA